MNEKGNYLATYAAAPDVASAMGRDDGLATTQLPGKPLTLPPHPPPIPAKDGFRPSVPPHSSRVPAEDIDKLASSKSLPIHCKLSPSPSQSVPLPQPSSPCSPPTQSPTGMNNSQAKTARKSAHISANRGDGHTSSGNVSRRTSVHQGPKSLMDGGGSASPGENNSASSTNGPGILARGSASIARVIIPTTHPNQCSPSKQLHQNVSPSGRQGMFSQHAHSPSRTPPIPIRENLESAFKAGRRKTATPKAAAIAQEPRMNVDGTTRKNSRKHQTDKPEERKAKRKRRTLVEGMGKFALPNPQGNSNARSKSSRPSAISTSVSGQPAERNASFSAPLIPTEVHQPQPGGPYAGQIPQSPVTPHKGPVDAISISSSSMSPPNRDNIIILSPGSNYEASGQVSDPRNSAECSIGGSESAGCSPSSGSDEGARGTDNKSDIQEGAVGAPTIRVIADGLERALREILPAADKFYEKHPGLRAQYSRQLFDDFLNKRGGMQDQERLNFLWEHLRMYTRDRRVLEWKEALPESFKPNNLQFALTHHLEVWGLGHPTIAAEKQPDEGSPERPKEKSPQRDPGTGAETFLQVGEENTGKNLTNELSPDETTMQRADLSQQAEAPSQSAVDPVPLSPADTSRHWPPESPTHTSAEDPQSASSSPQETPKDLAKPTPLLELRGSCIGGQPSSTASTTPPTSQPVLHPARIGRKKLTRPSPPEFAGESQSVVEARSRVLSSSSRQPKNPVLQRISHLRAREHSIWRELSDVAKKVKEKDVEFEKRIENAKVPIDDEMDPGLDSGLEVDSVVPIENERQKVSPNWEALLSIHTEQRSFHEEMKQQEMQLAREGSIINVEIKELQKRTSEQAAMVNQMAHRSPQCTESVLGDDDLTLPTKSSSVTVGSFNDLRDAPAFGGRRSILGIPMGDSLVEGLKLWSDALAPVATSNGAVEASEAARAKKRVRRRKMGW